MSIKSFCDNISIQGFSHKKTGKECQDNSISWREKDYCAVIVCDGHGGDKYIRSATGSRLACETGKKVISEFMKKFNPSKIKVDSALEHLGKSIVSEWLIAVEEDYTKHPIVDDERFIKLGDADQKALMNNPIKAYGSTFIAAVHTKKYCFISKLGDGNAVLFYADGTNQMPNEIDDDACSFNVTTSLCNNDAALSFRHCYKDFSGNKEVTGIILTSDGIINCYKTEESYISFIENIYSGYGEDSIENARGELTPALECLSEKGSGDDLSVAIIRNPFKLKIKPTNQRPRIHLCNKL